RARNPRSFSTCAARAQTVAGRALAEPWRAPGSAGAALDVFQPEPLPPENPFWELPNAFILPHLGGYTSEYEELIMPLIVENMRLFLAGRQRDAEYRRALRARGAAAPLLGAAKELPRV